jgi:hypothetical protein
VGEHRLMVAALDPHHPFQRFKQGPVS